MSKDKDKAKTIFDSWVKELEDQEQPEVCNIEDDDCEACGS